MEMSWDYYKNDQFHCSLPVAAQESPHHTTACKCVAKWAVLGILTSLNIEN